MAELMLLVAVVLIVLVIVLLIQNVSLKKGISQIRGEIDQKAHALYQVWRDNECDSIRTQQLEIARREYSVKYEEWRSDSEVSIRGDAIQKSQYVITGNVIQHIAPYLPSFKYNPKDVRFIGSPIDLIIFDGLSEGNLQQIVFVEVKTGRSKLEKNQRQVRDFVKEGKMVWDVIRVARED
jgi:predicted Holliday junction resolvase-like endonuclease